MKRGIASRARRVAGFGLGVILALGLLGCGQRAEPAAQMIYVDGTRGCKEPVAPVALWSAPGAAAVGARVVAEAPHGVLVEPIETTSQYGIVFYLIALDDGQQGWLPVNYSETIPPVCD